MELTKGTLDAVEKKHGQGTLVRLSDQPAVAVDAISTGCLPLDLALGTGGLPRGRIVELYGPESSGKSTIALHVIAEAQKVGGVGVYVDAEHSLDPIYAAAIGVQTDDLYVSQPDFGEQALDITDELIKSGEVSVIVVDSVAALVPRAEIEGDFGDSHVGLHARLVAQAMRKLTPALNRSGTVCIFINQLRTNIGGYGNPETTPGGRALKFFSSIRMDVRRIETIKSGSEALGNRTRVKVVKNKVGIPHRQAEFDIMYGEGINKIGCLLETASDLGVVTKSGAWLSYGPTQLGQGVPKSRAFLLDNPDLITEIDSKVRELL